MSKRNLVSTFVAAVAVVALSTNSHAAITAGDVIAVDLSTVGGTATNYNAFNAVGTIGSGVVNLDGDTIAGMTISFAGAGSGFNNDGGANAWPGTAVDPYYVGAADDITFRGGAQTVTYTGLDPSLNYNVRIYSLISNNAGFLEDFSVTDGAGTVGITGSSRGSRWTAGTLEAGGTVFNGVSANGSNEIAVTVTPNTSNAFLNAVTLEATAANVSVVGSLENNPNGAEIGNWSRASVAKTFDIDGDNRYGTDGYVLMNTSNSSGGAGPLASIVESSPSYTNDIAYATATTGFSSSFNGAENVLNPSDTGALNLGYAGVDSAPNIAVPLQKVFSYEMTRDMLALETIRVGVVLDSLADTQIGANALRLVAGGVAADATLVTGSRTGVMDAYFFDVTGLADGQFIEIWLGKEATGGINAATMGAVFFDSFVAVPAPAALPAGLAMLGLVAARRRRK